MTTQPDIMVTIDGRAWREAFEFARDAGPQAVEAFAAGFMRLLETTTAIAANTIQPPNPTFADKNGLIQIRPDCWNAKDPNTSFNWEIYAVQRLPHIDWGQPNICVYNGGLVHFGPKDHGAGSAPTFTVNLGRSAGKHEWSIHT